MHRICTFRATEKTRRVFWWSSVASVRASIDYGQSKDFIAHQIAAAGGVPNLENVARVDELPEKGFWVIALPVKIGKGSGGPVRIVAVVP